MRAAHWRIRRDISPAEPIPRGYGVAYASDFAHGYVCYPWPLNWGARWARNTWFWLRHPTRDSWEEEVDRRVADRISRKEKEAWERGYYVGLEDGRTEWQESLQDLLRKLAHLRKEMLGEHP